MLFYLYKSLKKKKWIRNIKINSKMKFGFFFGLVLESLECSIKPHEQYWHSSILNSNSSNIINTYQTKFTSGKDEQIKKVFRAIQKRTNSIIETKKN